MPRKKKGSLPNLCRHKASNRAYVTDPYTRKPVYLGPWGSPEAQAAYDRWTARLLARRGEVSTGIPAGSEVTVSQLVEAYFDHAERYYTKHGKKTSEVAAIRQMCGRINDLFGTVPVRDFGPSQLKACRQTWVDAGLARKHCNEQTSRVRRMFRWGVECELVPVEILQKLQAVKDLAKGRTTARESEKVPPVPAEHVEAVLAVANQQLQAIIRLQLLASMRPQDVCHMRGEDIDRTAEPWLYRPWSHKTEHHGDERVIPLGPKARAILTSLLEARPTGWLFVPFGHLPSCRKLDRHISVPSYLQLVGRACEKAGVPHWFPLQLRHSGLTEVRKQYGLEGAQVIGGHKNAKTTEIYAEADLDLAKKIAEENG